MQSGWCAQLLMQPHSTRLRRLCTPLWQWEETTQPTQVLHGLLFQVQCLWHLSAMH